MSSPNTYPCSSSALPSSPQPTSVVASSSSTEVPASSALAPVRGNKRIYAGFVAAPSLEEVADSVVSDSGDESETTSQELARLRSEIHSSQAAQATAEASFTKEIMRRESLQMACSSARREMKQTQTEVHRLRERQSSVLQELDAFNVQVDVHKELYQRLENCIKSAEDEFQRLTQYTSPQKKVFTATVATNTSQIRRLHHLLSDSDIADDSANTRLERRNEDIRDQVKRVSSTNKALCFSTCELNWELLDVSGQTRDILKRLYVMKDSTMSGENFAAGLAWIACREESDAEFTSTLVFASGDKFVYNLWKWCISTDLRFAAITPEILFEPSMPGYSFEYLTWIPGSSYWLSHVLALDAAEPWHSGWVDAPAQHHYNTTFAPCNPGFPLFVPTGQTRETVGCQIQVNPVLTSSEIAPDWDVDFRVPSAAPTAPAPAGDSAAMAEESSTIDDANLL
ncbi:hypothetical protein PC122_g18037 [Phytophthora cactorum]|nr:hypothetical protein PC122_g18037 [Phytophthora cactorum]